MSRGGGKRAEVGCVDEKSLQWNGSVKMLKWSFLGGVWGVFVY